MVKGGNVKYSDLVRVVLETRQLFERYEAAKDEDKKLSVTLESLLRIEEVPLR